MPKLNFLHIPKTAGLSFFYFLEECFGRSNCIRFGDDESVMAFHLNSELDKLSDFIVVSGHLSLDDFNSKNLINGNRITVAFVRDPLEREISCYKHFFATQQVYHRHHFDINTIESLEFFFGDSGLSFKQTDQIKFNSNVCTVEQYLNMNVFVFPVSFMPLVASTIKNNLNLCYFPCPNNVTPSIFSQSDDFLIKSFVEQHVIPDRKLDKLYFENVCSVAPALLDIFESTFLRAVNAES